MKARRRRTASTPVTAVAAAMTTACGGGGDNPNIRPDGPAQETQAAASARIERVNTHAADIADHWETADPFSDGLEALGESDPKEGLAAAIGSYYGEARPATASIRAAGAGNVVALDTRNDVTVGRWTSGPVGTMGIEFYYDRSADVTDAQKATIERAAKAWTRYIRTQFDDHTVDAGTVIEKATRPPATVHTDVEVDDFLIVVSTTTEDDGRSWGGASRWSRRNGQVAVPGIGYIDLNTSRGGLPGHYSVVHEIGHAIQYTEPTVEGAYNPTRERYLSEDGHHFEGPEAMKANGGEPVPFQWVDAELKPVAPGTPGAELDLGHIGVCTSVMAYCSDRDVVTMPSALDIAWLRDKGHVPARVPEFTRQILSGNAWVADVRRIRARIALQAAAHCSPLSRIGERPCRSLQWSSNRGGPTTPLMMSVRRTRTLARPPST